MRKFRIPGRPYCGSLEEVVLWRKDLEGQEYTQDRVVTLYNLDFCGEICSQVETREHGRACWRFEAIRQVLLDQRECYEKRGGPRHFILMLTVRNQITPGNVGKYLPDESMHEGTRAFFTQCSGENPLPADTHRPLIGSHPWALKAILYTHLQGHFDAYEFGAALPPGSLHGHPDAN